MVGGNLVRGRNIQRLRYQVGGAVLFAAFIPYALRWLTLNSAQFLPTLTQTLWGSVAAILIGTWLFRNVSTYPGVEKAAYVLPAFTISYTLLLVVFVVGRVDYNRTVLISGYLISLSWFLILNSASRRTTLRIGVLPFGERARLQTIPGVHWIPLTDPKEAYAYRLDAVAADLRSDLPADWDARLADFALAGVPVYHVKLLEESLTGRVDLEHLSENSFGSLTPVSAFMSIKTAIDWITALAAGVVLFPILLAVGLAIRATSPGPAMFRQRRIGYKGEAFTVYKFRTMTAAPLGDDDALRDAMTKPQDVRITRFGRFLRQTRIDELPQILNILNGEMSWIGPRPEAEVLSRWYEAEIPFYRYRHVVRPGIAGWAQVCQGHVIDIGEVRSKLHYDFYYIKHYSAWIDLLIIVRTVRTVLTGFGSR